MSNYNYNPFPPRVWSRVQNSCTFFDLSSNYTSAYIPLTGQTVSQAQADYEMKQFYKGNILQYKGNSARLTKSQKYSQLARCAGPNRTKVFATQTETYTNPNTTGLLRAGYTTYPFPNQIVGAPNNISGPFAYNVLNPNDCSSNSVQDGGILVCGTYANPCTGEIFRTGVTTATICNPASASNVPGPGFLCWNNNIQTWFPKPRYVNNNSTDKWPVNYKGFVSAIRPPAPILDASSNCPPFINLNWVQPTSCLTITSYNIYVNDLLYDTTPATNTTYTIFESGYGQYNIYIKSLSNTIESEPSNTVTEYLISESPPSNVSAYTNAPNSVIISWSSLNQTVDSFKIYRSTNISGPFTLIATIPVSLPYPMSYTNTSLVNNTTYYYYVTANYGICESIPSSVVSATPLPLYTTTGTTNLVGSYLYFTSSTSTFGTQTGTITFNYTCDVEFTLVAGGSSGGYWSIGSNSGSCAGGGGEVLKSYSAFVVKAGSTSIISVGAGAPLNPNWPPTKPNPPYTGTGLLGIDTKITINSLLLNGEIRTNNAIGGGGGGIGGTNQSWNGGGGIGSTGGNMTILGGGTCGGGGGGGGALVSINTNGFIVGPSSSFGNNGGNGGVTNGGNGGNGKPGIDGILYGAGGGGGSLYNAGGIGGTGGATGGGNGSTYNTSVPPITTTPALPGAPNTGGGGGGGTCDNVAGNPLDPEVGGSGVVIFKISLH